MASSSESRRRSTFSGAELIVGLGHLDLVCRDLQRSLDFYRAVFGPLGLQEPTLFDGERGEQIHYRPQYAPEYYATFFLDPDGFRIEVASARDARLI